MKNFRYVCILFLILLFVIAVSSCSEDRATDVDLTDQGKISDLLLHDVSGKTAYPRVWIDTVSRLESYAKATSSYAPINPLDYWVEMISYGCTITVVDSCAPDEYNESDSCAEIQLGSGIRAKAYVANILDSILCRYHIVERSDSTIYTKTVKYKEAQTALMGKLEKNETQYGGWRIFALGRQRLGVGYNQISFPAVDSIVLQSLARDEVRKAYYPTRAIAYQEISDLVSLYPGEPVRLTAYTRARFSNPPITDAYVHYDIDGTVYHEWMGVDVSNNEDAQIYEWDVNESSGRDIGTFSQFAVELFQEHTLRDDGSQFANLIWAITYRLEP